MTRALIALSLLILTACSKPDPAFVDKVWSVTRSTAVAPGTLYVFLSEGTLVITSPNSTPMNGKWTRTDSGLTMTEEGQTYRVDILKLTDTTFSIRSHNPGTPVDIEMSLAPSR
jgi:hypothetical protein